MPKRFIDTEIWQKEEFLDATNEFKLLSIYVFTNCNHIGILKKPLRLISFEIGFTVTEEMIMSIPFSVERIGDKVYWLSEFCYFQYGELKETCKPHKRYISDLKKVGLFERVCKGYAKGISTLEEKEKEEDIRKKKKNKNKKEVPTDYTDEFEGFWKFYNKGNKKKSFEQWVKLTEDQICEIRNKSKAYVDSTEREGKRYRKNGEVYLNPKNEHWNDPVMSDVVASNTKMRNGKMKDEYTEPDFNVEDFLVN